MVILAENLELIICSFLASFGLGVVFHIPKRGLVWAGVAGALTRCSVLIMPALTDIVFLQALVSAVLAGLFAEIMAMRRRLPSTVFLYPAIIPLIPGGTIYYLALNVLIGSEDMALAYASECIQSLSGICIGFVLISTFTYYRRVYYATEHLERSVKEAVKTFLGIGK